MQKTPFLSSLPRLNRFSRLAQVLGLAVLLGLGSVGVGWARQGHTGPQPASTHSTSALEFFVSPTGGPSGDGSLENPWDFKTAIAPHPAIQPGSTIWMRGGVYSGGPYTSRLNGTLAQPIHVRPYQNEHVILDASLLVDTSAEFFQVYSNHTWYWDIESTILSPLPRIGGDNLEVSGMGNKLINWVIHDTANNAFGRSGNEIYGSILYNNGVDGNSGLHQLYVQNPDPNFPTVLRDNIVFNAYEFGIHAYASGSGQINGVQVVGNVLFQNGAAKTVRNLKDNIIFAGINGLSQIILQENMTWATGPNVRSLALGRYWNLNHDITLTNNYIYGDTWFANPFESVTMNGNTFYNPPRGINTVLYPNNTYLTTAPTSNKIFIRPNVYEPKRAHIVVYNWQNLDFVSVDLSGVLSPGDWYEIRNAQNFYAPPLVISKYTGGTIQLPMSGLSPAQPTGPGLIENVEMTGKAFNVFVLLPRQPIETFYDIYLPLVAR